MKLPHHNRYPYSPIQERPDYSWPGGRRLAVYIATNIEVSAFEAGRGHDPTRPGGPQTQRNFAWRDYGNRVGIWRLFDLYDSLNLPNACLVNSLLADEHPQILARAESRGDDIVAHGRTNAETQKGLWEVDEARLIEDATSGLSRAVGGPPKGWLGAGGAETGVSADLLQEAGYDYLLDWPADDQPFWIDTRGGRILSVPYPFELNDAGQLLLRAHTANEFADMIVNQFDEMIEQCVEQPLVFSISLHPFIVGQPFRLPPLRRALEHIVNHEHRNRIWFTGPDAISEYCHALEPGIIPGSRRLDAR